MATIQGTISSLKLAGDIMKGMLDLKTFNEVSGKVAQLQSAILSAQSSAMEANSAQFSMIEEIRELKAEIARIKAWDTEKGRYKLQSVATGGVAYALKESMSNSEPPHYICTSCYENGRKSILNQIPDANGWTFFTCPSCKSKMPTGYRGDGEMKYAPD
ncbi:MAG: hypothetical protein ACHP7O_02480 [Burkholderiales bacterium]